MTYRDQVYFDFQPETEIPFSEAEFDNRLLRVRAKMAQDGIDCMLLTSPESMYYISGYICMWYHTESPVEWPPSNGIAVHVDHQRFIHFETEREAVLTRTFTVSKDTRYFPKDSYRDGTRFIVDELKAEGWLEGRVGMEFWAMQPNRVISQKIQTQFEAAGAEVVDGSHVLREVRWVKSPAEIECLEESCRIATAGLNAAREVIRPGVTELEVQGEVIRALCAAGGELQAMMMPVLSGGKSNAAHAVATRKKIKAGETVTVDVAGVHKRYHMNAARTFSVGEPAKDVAAKASLAAGVMNVVRECLRPNLPVREFNERVKGYYEAHNLWDQRGWIGGYEMGIAFLSDWVGNMVYDPLVEKNADRLFEPGTAVNHEVQILVPRFSGQFFMIESLLFKEDEVRMATHEVPYGLIICEG